MHNWHICRVKDGARARVSRLRLSSASSVIYDCGARTPFVSARYEEIRLLFAT